MGMVFIPKTLDEVLIDEINYLEKISEFKRINSLIENQYQEVNEKYISKLVTGVSELLVKSEEMSISAKTKIEDKIKNQENTTEEKKEEIELLTIKEVCEQFKISRTTLSNWRKKGLIEYIKIGRNIYFKKSAIMNMIEKSKRLNNRNKK